MWRVVPRPPARLSIGDGIVSVFIAAIAWVIGFVIGLFLTYIFEPGRTPWHVARDGGYVGGVILAVAFTWLYLKNTKDENESSATTAAESAATQAREILTLISRLGTEATELAGQTDACIARANSEYQSNAASTYWTAIYRATESLADARARIDSLRDACTRYAQVLHGWEHTFPTTPSIPSLPALGPLSRRLHATMRMGQTNRDFTMVWELHQLRRAVITGFADMEDAIDRLPAAIDQSMSRVAGSVSASISNAAHDVAAQAEIANTRLLAVHRESSRTADAAQTLARLVAKRRGK